MQMSVKLIPATLQNTRALRVAWRSPEERLSRRLRRVKLLENETYQREIVDDFNNWKRPS